MEPIQLTQKEEAFIKKLKPAEDMGRGELSKHILRGVAVGVGVASVFMAPGLAIGYRWFENLNRRHKNNLRTNFKRLIDGGFIFEKEPGKYYLTPEGLLKKNENEIKDLKMNNPKVWDGVWRIIAFDVPEGKKQARMALNLKLKQLGFHVMQRSVFIYPHPCKKEFEVIGKFFGIEEDIIFIETDTISLHESLAEKFVNKGIIKINK